MAMESVGIVTALHKRRALEIARNLVAWLEARKVRVRLLRDCAERMGRAELAVPHAAIAETDLAVVLGGDGSVLATARACAPAGTPVLAVDLGGFGFLSEVKAAGLMEAMERLLRGEFRLEERLMLRAAVVRAGVEVEGSVGLNDATITKGAFSRMMRLQAFVGGQYVALYPADGIIVATPTGSTAYSLSAGGPIVHPNVHSLLLTPICAHTLFTRPLIIAENEEVRLLVRWQQSQSEEVMLTVDGQVGIYLRSGDEVVVRRAEHPARLVKLDKDTFYERLREKLQWGGEL